MYNLKWTDLNWSNIEATIFQWQRAINAAVRAGDYATARNYQEMFINTQEAKLSAVRLVLSNSGSKSPGIDGYLPQNDEEKFQLVNNTVLNGDSYFVKRVLIPKPGTEEMRPLGIPTILDRCKQSLCKLAIEPEMEARFESNSFGFRPGRSCIDAISKIRAHLIFKGPCYVLDTDIRKCFDRIGHQPLLYKLGQGATITTQIESWLRAGIFSKNEIIFPKTGTPQGGIISPLLANAAIDGIQRILEIELTKIYGPVAAKQTYYIRYADDLVVLGPSLEVILEAKAILEFHLAQIGLELKTEATRIIKTLDLTKNEEGKNIIKSEHFDFLGFRFKQRFLSKHKSWKAGGKQTNVRTLVLINPSRIQRHKASISALLKKIGNVESLIKTLNPRIIGWCNYFKNSDAKEYGDLPRKMDIWINTKIRKWIRRTSKLRGKAKQFWIQDSKDWVLYYKDKDGNVITLVKYVSFKWSIYDYKSINSYYDPYSDNNNKGRNSLT